MTKIAYKSPFIPKFDDKISEIQELKCYGIFYIAQ